MIQVAILGCTGRMGRALLEAIAERDDFKVSGAMASSANAAIGSRVGDYASAPTVTADRAVALSGAQVAIDFTLPAAVSENVAACLERRVPLLLGTTALEPATLDVIERASSTIPILQSPNMSVGVNVLLDLVAAATKALGAGYDVEILDLHHKDKRDAPSGTALKLGEVIARARGEGFDPVAVRERVARAETRRDGEIGFTALRAGDHVGEHTVTFSTKGESLALVHRATDRLTFARGALRAARWLTQQPPGQYDMGHVIRSGT